MSKKANQKIDGSDRIRVKQTRKSALDDRSMKYVQEQKKRTPWIERRSMPRAENKLDAILAVAAVLLGILCVVCVFLFFTGLWSKAGSAFFICIGGIALIGAGDNYVHSRNALIYLVIAAIAIGVGLFL